METALFTLLALLMFEVPTFAKENVSHLLDAKTDCAPFDVENLSQLHAGLNLETVTRILGRQGLLTIGSYQGAKPVEIFDWCNSTGVVVVGFKDGLSVDPVHRTFN